jgi:hypothetical protein
VTYGDNADSPRPWGLKSQISWCADGSTVEMEPSPSVEGTTSPVLNAIPYAAFQWELPLTSRSFPPNTWLFGGTGQFCADPLDLPGKKLVQVAVKFIVDVLAQLALDHIAPEVVKILLNKSPKACLDVYEVSQTIQMRADGSYSIAVGGNLSGSGEVTVYHNGGDIRSTLRVSKPSKTFSRMWGCSIAEGCSS